MKENSVWKNRRLFLALSWVGVAAVILLSVWAGGPMVRFISQPERFRDWVERSGVWGVLGYCCMVFLQVVVALLPGEPFEIAGGYAFGALWGTALYLAAATAGSMAVFALVRRFGRPLVRLYFPEEKLRLLRFLGTGRKRELLFAFLFLLPGTPKDLMCYFAGLTELRWSVWLLISSLGRLPAAITSTLGGDALGTGNYGIAIAVFVLALAISGGGLWLFQKTCRENA